MRSSLVITVVLLVLVIAGGLLNAQVTRDISNRYVSAAEELMALTEAGDWERAAQVAGDYHSSWEETLQWLEILVNHDDADDVTLALIQIEAGIRTRDLVTCTVGCNELKENAMHIYHRDAFTIGNIL